MTNKLDKSQFIQQLWWWGICHFKISTVVHSQLPLISLILFVHKFSLNSNYILSLTLTGSSFKIKSSAALYIRVKPSTVSTSLSTYECISCLKAKMSKLYFSMSFSTFLTPLELIHSNVWGLFPIISSNGYLYYFSFIVNFTKFTWLFPLAYKSMLLFINFYQLPKIYFLKS